MSTNQRSEQDKHSWLLLFFYDDKRAQKMLIKSSVLRGP